MAGAFDIAIIGMAGRFPGARSVGEFWRNLAGGVESISTFTDDEVRASGVSPALLADPHYVKAGGVLDDVEWFDAEFFGYPPREAEVMDPQQRVFLECAWQALERAGYDSERYRRPIGVYAGMSMNSYVLSNLIFNPAAVEAVGEAQAAISNLHDHLATRVSYKLDLRGPSFTVQTACSTSLVAVHLACQALLGGECDMALAGGVSIGVPQKTGYLYHEGGTHSPDGHCRAFDARAAGMVGGSGVGVIVLKRLDDALADGDHLVAIVKGTAINNDGSSKVGYTAPSVEGQARVVRAALRVADVAAETIGYVETHGTGTAIGDPIEVEALARVFQRAPAGLATCGLGSVKTNIGHLDAAAGVAGLIKVALALDARYLPPSLHFEQPNPRIDFAATPFRVVSEGHEWPGGPLPRRAGVSSFGIGGTNAHAVLEQAPDRHRAPSSDQPHICVVSARTATALETARAQLADHLEGNPEQAFGDVAWTLQAGRRNFPHRAAVVARSAGEAASLLRADRAPQLFTAGADPAVRATALLFPGQGSQYQAMARPLYRRYPAFRDALDQVDAAMAPSLGVRLGAMLGYDDPPAQVMDRLLQTEFAQPAIFAVEYAMARLLASVGLTPAAYLGHSIGEYVAACLAGVFTLTDAAEIVVLRGKLMADAPRGAMLAVMLPEAEVGLMLDATLSLAAANGPSACVLAGDFAAITRLEHRLTREGVACSRLHTSHAFHSHLMDGVVAPLAAAIAARPLSPPRVPFVSNLTGRWIEPAEAVDPQYWARHLREPVRFADGVVTLAQTCSRLIEAGPGTALAALARQALVGQDVSILSSLPRGDSGPSADEAFLDAVARLWTERVRIDWPALHDVPARRRVPLPTYPFERQRYWIDPIKGEPAGVRAQAHDAAPVLRFYVPSWRRGAARPVQRATRPARVHRWLVLCDASGLGTAIARGLELAGQKVTAVPVDTGSRPASIYQDVVAALHAGGSAPDAIVHCLGASPTPAADGRAARARSFDSLVAIARAVEAQRIFTPLRLEVVSTNLYDVLGTEALDPFQALSLGPLRVIPQEYQNITSRCIDVAWDAASEVEQLAGSVVAELTTESRDQEVALRAGHRWTQHYLPADEHLPALAVPGPTVIFGGLGRIGLVAARALAAASSSARLVLVSRYAEPNAAVIRDLEQLGAEVLVLSGNVADERSVREVFARARARFGPVECVIHAAGPSGASTMSAIADLDETHVEAQFGAKVDGLVALGAVVADEAPALVLLTSSLSTVLGGLGFAAYAAGNAVMDAFGAAKNRTGPTRWVAVDWDGWRFDATDVAGAIDQRQGVAAFTRLASADFGPRVIVTATDLEPRLARWINPAVAAKPTPPVAVVPRQRTTATAPAGNDVERLVLQVWHELLGVADIGVDDSFFELGGHSLLATQLVSRLRRALMLEVPLRVVFDDPTVRGIAAAVIAREPQPGQAAATARLRLQLGQMSAEQMKAMMAARQPQPVRG